jgi:hypothetical protein
MQEGGTKAVLIPGSDIDEDVLTYSVTSGTNITSSIDGATITFSVSDDNWNGSEQFTATVSDGEYASNQIFTVTVQGVNDPPVLATVSDVIFAEDATGSVSLSASDIDDDDLTYSVSEGTVITATLDGSDITFSAPLDFNGSETFTVSVSDTEYTDSQIITVTITPVNDAPSLDVVDDQTMQEGGAKAVILSGSDIDNDALSYSITTSPSNGTATVVGSVIMYTPNSNYFGSDTIAYKVNDGTVDSNIGTISITVNNVLDDVPAVIDSTSDLSGSANSNNNITGTLTATHVDGLTNANVFSINTDASNGQASINATSGVWTYIPNTSFDGTDSFVVTITSDLGNTTDQTISLTVLNTAPVFNDININALSGVSYLLDLSIYTSDVDGDSLTVNIASVVFVPSDTCKLYTLSSVNVNENVLLYRVVYVPELFNTK